MKKYFIVTLILVLFLIGLYVYKLTNYTYISAKFEHLRPIEENIPVYYKGIVIGKAKEKKHSETMSHTLIQLVLYPKNLMLPKNTTVLLKKEKKRKEERDFLELIYPQNPSTTMLSNGSIINGEATVDIDTFMANQKENELEEIKENLAQSAQNLNYALESLGQIFETIDEILKENQENLYQTTTNFKNATSKIESSIDRKKLQNTLSSIESTTKNFSNITKNFDKETPETHENINQITSNLNSITCGIRKTLRKKCGGLRLFFGQVIDECN